jgi:hypothetical protein
MPIIRAANLGPVLFATVFDEHARTRDVALKQGKDRHGCPSSGRPRR